MRIPMRKWILRDKSGFTMLEIMAVLAILGILAGLTIPKFQRMVYKANQKSAIVALTSAYIAEKNFAAENNTYTTCLRNIGMNNSAVRWYTVGINGNAIGATCGPASN